MKTYTVHRDGDTDLCFTGEMIGYAEETELCTDRACTYAFNRTTMLLLYKTQAGKYIAEKIVSTDRYGDPAKHKAKICDTTSKIYQFFGKSDLAQQLYKMTDFPPEVVQ